MRCEEYLKNVVLMVLSNWRALAMQRTLSDFA